MLIYSSFYAISLKGISQAEHFAYKEQKAVKQGIFTRLNKAAQKREAFGVMPGYDDFAEAETIALENAFT